MPKRIRSLISANSKQPAHAALPLWLPISASTIAKMTSGDSAEVVGALSTPELAATLVLMKLGPNKSMALGAIENMLSSAIAAANEAIGAGANPLRVYLTSNLDAALLKGVLPRLDELSLILMDDDEVKSRKYLHALGAWDFDYRKQRVATSPLIQDPISAYPESVTMTDAQVRVTECLLLNKDEPLHVQGYAGTGKTHLLVNILNLLPPPKRPLVLCQTLQQARAIHARVPHTHAMLYTFQELALEVLDHDDGQEPCRFAYARPSAERMSSDTQVSDTQIATYLGFQPVGNLSAPRVANLCRRMVMRFCYGPAAFISPASIPRGFNFSAVEQSVLVEYANTLWRETLIPLSGLDVPIRAYHLIKMMALKGCAVPSDFTHVIVDESHDLSVPMIQVLERSPQAFITLGDDLQSLSGHVMRHSATVRSRTIGQAVRAGEAMESVLTPLIQAHPLSPIDPYKGNRSVGTVISHYDNLNMPDKPTTILVKDLWGLFEWFLRLSPEGNACRYELLGNRYQFNRFIRDVVELFNNGTRPRHALLARHSSWDKLYETEVAAGNKAIERIARRLERGLTKADLEQMLFRSGTDTTTGYRLGLVSEVRNREFESVMLTPDLLPQPKSMGGVERGQLLTAIYTGASRAKNEIIVPGYLADWVSDLTRLSGE